MRPSELLQQHLYSQTNEAVVRFSYRLSIVATVFLPLTFVTGLLGMNVAGIPADHDPSGFWAVSGILFGLGVVSWLLLNRLGPFRWQLRSDDTGTGLRRP